jgi:hypothetical protein
MEFLNQGFKKTNVKEEKMKKHLIIVCMVVFGLFLGQNAFAEFGLKAGLNFSTVSDTDGDSKTGLIFGAFYSYELNDSFSIQPELLYIQNGNKAEEGGITFKTKLDYLVIPVLAKFKFQGSETVKPYVLAGPYLGLKMSAKLSAEGDGGSADTDLDGAKGTTFGVTFGAGIGVKMGDGNILVEARYNLGLSNIYDADYLDCKNRSFSLMVGYGFN